MKQTESLIFDIDGTLWDSRALVADGYNIQLRKEGLDHLCVTAEDFIPLFGKVNSELADALFASIPVPERYELIARCVVAENRYLEESTCDIGYPQVKETLAALAKNHRLFIVSNSPVGYPEVCVKKLGLEGLIEGTLCHGETGLPKGQTIRLLMDKYHITSCCYIGDTQMDYEATVEAGIPFLWAAYGFGTPERFDAKVDSFCQLTDLF